MARSASDFLQSLLKNITTYYTATYSSDTDLYAILETYGAELSSGSIAIETVRNNLFIVTCENTKLFDNFGTYFNQTKYFNQDYNEDKYVQSNVAWAESGSALYRRYSENIYTEPFGLASFVENPWSFSVPMGAGEDHGKHPYASVAYSGSLIMLFRGNPLTSENPYKGIYSPWRLSAYKIATDEWIPIESRYDWTAGAIYLFAPVVMAPYSGRSIYKTEKFWVWDVFDTTLTYPPPLPGAPEPPDTEPRILLYEYGSDFNQIEYDSTTSATPLSYHVSSPDTAGWNGTKRSIVFHDKIFMGWSHDDDDPHLVSYDPINDAFADHDLHTYAQGTISGSATFNIHEPIVDHLNRIIVEVDYSSPSGSGQKLYAFDGTNWAVLTAPDESVATRKLESLNDTLYALSSDQVMVYNDATDIWTIVQNFNGLYPQDMLIFNNQHLLVSVSYGTVYRLDNGTNQFVTFYQSDDNSIKDTLHLLVEATFSPLVVYGYYQDRWYSSSFEDTTSWAYFWPAPTISGSVVQNAAISSYRKQLDFMLEAAIHGGTRKGIVCAANAFTLVNPDIREPYEITQWKLKREEYDVIQLSTNVWQFSGSLNWRANEYQGAHATFISGSILQDRIAAGYLVIVNDNNTVTVGAIEDKRLLLNLVRPS